MDKDGLMLGDSIADDVCAVLVADGELVEDAVAADTREEGNAVADDETLLDEELETPQDPYCGWQPVPQKLTSEPLR